MSGHEYTLPILLLGKKNTFPDIPHLLTLRNFSVFFLFVLFLIKRLSKLNDSPCKGLHLNTAASELGLELSSKELA